MLIAYEYRKGWHEVVETERARGPYELGRRIHTRDGHFYRSARYDMVGTISIPIGNLGVAPVRKKR